MNSNETISPWICVLSLVLIGLFPLSLAVAAIIYQASNSKERRRQSAAWIKAQREYVRTQVQNIQRQALARFNMLL